MKTKKKVFAAIFGRKFVESFSSGWLFFLWSSSAQLSVGGRLNLDGGTVNLDGGTLTLDGGTRLPASPCNLSTVYNYSKNSIFMVVSQTAKTSDSSRLYVDNEELTTFKICKCLGVWIVECLNWKAGVAKLSSFLSKTVCVLLTIRNNVSIRCLKILHCILIQPKLTYGSFTWEGTTKENLSQISTV